VSARARVFLVAPSLGLLALASRFFPAPFGALLAYVGLGLLPGLGVATLIMPAWSLGARLTLGLALSPLVATLLALPMLQAGLDLSAAASAVVVIAVATLVVASLRDRGASGGAVAPGGDAELPLEALRGTPDGRFVLLWSLGLAVAVAIPALVNRYVPIRGDAWIHAGIVWEIVHRGLPPEDPRFAGLTLNYVWLFNAFIALLVRLSGDGPFAFMPLFNVVQAGLTASLAYRIGLAAWHRRAAARGTLLMVVLGFSAGTWLLWPLGLLRPLLGESRGPERLAEYLQTVKFPSAEIIFSLSAPYGYMVNFFDKLLTGTALHYAYVLMMVHLWAWLLWLADRRARWLVVAAASAAGMLFFHGVVGLSVVPVSLAVIVGLAVVRLRWPWLPSRSSLAGFGAATAIGAALAGPYTRSISAGWAAEKSGLEHHYLALDAVVPWTLIAACAVAWWFAIGPIARAFRERRAGPATALAAAIGMSAFTCVVRLPGANETKFVFAAFVPLAVLAGAGWADAWGAWRRRLGRTGARVAFAAAFLVIPVLSIAGFALDPGPRTRPELNPRPGEAELYRWIRASTPVDAVFVDARYRDLIMVTGQRELYLGTHNGPEKAAFPLTELLRRRALVADVYGEAHDWASHRAALAALGRPVYVVYRPEDADGRSPWAAIDGDPRAERVYDAGGYRVHRLRAADEAAR
jgi:hypothetical protein